MRSRAEDTVKERMAEYRQIKVAEVKRLHEEMKNGISEREIEDALDNVDEVWARQVAR